MLRLLNSFLFSPIINKNIHLFALFILFVSYFHLLDWNYGSFITLDERGECRPESIHLMHFLLFIESPSDFSVFIPFPGPSPNVLLSGFVGHRKKVVLYFYPKKMYPWLFIIIFPQKRGKDCSLILSGDPSRRHQGNASPGCYSFCNNDVHFFFNIYFSEFILSALLFMIQFVSIIPNFSIKKIPKKM